MASPSGESNKVEKEAEGPVKDASKPSGEVTQDAKTINNTTNETSAQKDSVISSKKGSEQGVGFFHKYRNLLLAAHIILAISMLLWPWIFVGVIWAHHSEGGLRASEHITSLVRNNPHATNFFITTITGIMSSIISYVFTTAVMCLYRERSRTHPEGFLVRFFKPFLQADGWSVGELWVAIKTGEKVIALLSLLALYKIVFTLISPGLNAIVIPVEYSHKAPLNGTELDFGTPAADCQAWIKNNPIPDLCNWMEYNGFEFTDCLGENQFLDVLDSGRNNMQALAANNTQTTTFRQLNSLHFLGPIHGVFPIGPNGISAFNTLQNPRGDTYKTSLGYNYTVDLQGIVGDVSCSYDTSSPITLIQPATFGLTADPRYLPFYNATCPPGTVSLTNVTLYPIPNGLNHTMGSWVCVPSTSNGTGTYMLYMSGAGNYANLVGSITCTLSGIAHALYEVSFSTDSNLFTVSNTTLSVSNVSSTLLDRSVFAIWDVFGQSQGLVTNFVVESAVTYAVRNYGLSLNAVYVRNNAYLRLFEALIQGILQYEATYTRLIYSSYSSPPASCLRSVTGQMYYEVFGWQTSKETVAYLIPLTVVNLTSVVLLIRALFWPETAGYHGVPQGNVDDAEANLGHGLQAAE